MLTWGVGLGVLTPAVVAAALSAVPARHAGLASGVNNTARQAGGVAGIALYGSIAGSPADPARFVAGLHLTGADHGGALRRGRGRHRPRRPASQAVTAGPADGRTSAPGYVGFVDRMLSSPEAAAASAARRDPLRRGRRTTS